tara:strand:+ start:1149 stop:1454 length:306 start_codon:yes stop_codon:yes gene_type:complete
MNQRGEYQTLNKRGDPVVYEETDVVIYNGSTYISQRRNTYLDGLPDATDGPWDLLSSRINHVSGKNVPPNPSFGDEWYDTENAILFKYLDDGNSAQWVEIG